MLLCSAVIFLLAASSGYAIEIPKGRPSPGSARNPCSKSRQLFCFIRSEINSKADKILAVKPEISGESVCSSRDLVGACCDVSKLTVPSGTTKNPPFIIKGDSFLTACT